MNTPGGSPGLTLENSPSKEAGGRMDFGWGQPLSGKETLRNTPALKAVTASQRSVLSMLNRPRANSFSATPLTHDEKEGSAVAPDLKNDELIHDDKWKEVTGKKRLRSPDTLLRIQKQTKLNTYWLGVPVQTSNRFAALEKENRKVEEATPEGKSPKPPPVYMDRVCNIQPLIDLLQDSVEGEYEIKILKAEEVKI